MRSSFSVPLEFSHKSADPTIYGVAIKPLEYDLAVAEEGQSRFSSRLVAKPKVDTSKYTCRSVIDWIWMEFEVGSNTETGKEAQSYWISEKLKPILGGNPMVTGPNVPHTATKWPNHQGTSFRIKVQDPSPKLMLEIRNLIDKNWTLVAPMKIIGIEIALDWRSKSQSDQERWEMVAALMRHHLPNSKHLNGPRANLRNTYNHPLTDLSSEDDKRSRTEFVVQNPSHRYVPVTIDDGDNWAASDNVAMGEKPIEVEEKISDRKKSDQDIKDPDVRRGIFGDFTIKAPFLDGTLYLGEEGAPVMFRIQNKLKDGRNSQTKRVVELGPEDRRARIEVTLLAEAIAEFGFDTLEGLYGFKFARLRENLFDFWLPTFLGNPKAEDSLQGVFREARGLRQRQAFVNGGVYAHQIREEALRVEEKLDRRRWRNAGLEVSNISRKGQGKSGTRKAWSELNEQCRDALYNMSRRWKAELL